ncbi:ATP-grasp domain-containing protein [Sneathiella sp.]|uniref:ATP-grasp domain-containing protein n=1 Tax=Sneathiella sp. TaxID=1964365 RepID=UPI00356528C1
MTGRVLLLVPTTSYRIGDFLAAADRLGIDVAVGSNQRQVLEQFSKGRTVTLDFNNVDKGVAEVIAYNETYPITAIIGVDDETTLIAARAAKALNLVHNSQESIETARNKYRFRTRLANSGLLAPRFTLQPVEADPIEASVLVNYPVVLKPLALSASRGVIRANEPSEFVAAFERIKTILNKADIDENATGHILIEDYIPGDEVALEGLLDGGNLTILALFDKPNPLVGPYFEETLYITPSRLSPCVQKDIATAVSRAVAALGLRHGPIHAELRINDRGVWLIEVAARSIGGLCSRVLSFGPNGSLEDLILKHALGQPNPRPALDCSASGVMMMPIPAAGVLRQVLGLEDARALAMIDDVTLSIPLGATLVPLPEGNRYLGFIFASGDTPAAVEATLRDAYNFLEFVIEAEENSPTN